MTYLVNIIGAGHLGKTLGRLLAQQESLIKIAGICNSSKTSTLAALKFIGSGAYYPILEMPPADITLIATPDDCLLETCAELAKNPSLKEGSIVMHCSGSLSSEVLNAVKEKSCLIASVHPMRSFAKPELSVEDYEGTYCAIEGDAQAILILKSLFEKIGSITYEIDKRKKSSYHAAGVFASNYVVTLAQQALTCLEEAGVENDIAMHVITTLMKSSVSNLEQTLSPTESLTGPLKRGDIATIKKHMDALTGEQKDLYALLGKATLELTQHGLDVKKSIEGVLT